MPYPSLLMLSGSSAIDAGNPRGFTDGLGHLLTTDQRACLVLTSQKTRPAVILERMKDGQTSS